MWRLLYDSAARAEEVLGLDVPGLNLANLGEANVSAPLLMAISGHKQLATLQQYVKPSQDAVARLMADTDPDRRRR
ncbi:MAG TPA: hypothetical protein VFV41_21320 [Streptosporangiaceae bacterium]|nr:hypothetical protein [Streptosporangiaceae bacterium]